MNVKQVIVMRKDLKMRRGKEIAQGAHAAMAWLIHRFGRPHGEDYGTADCYVTAGLSEAELSWIEGLFTKVCLQVESEGELNAIHQDAMREGLEVHLITDAGKTEFGGVPTKTCLAIGPDEAAKIDPITSRLKLY